MILKRIEPISCAKIYGVVCVLIGLLAGIIVAGIAWAMEQVFTGMGEEAYPVGLGYLFGAGAIISYPIFYGIFGFVAGFLSAVVYNWIAGLIGGIELEFE